MKKKLFGCLLSIGLLLSLTVSAFANTYNGGDDWHVNFTPNKTMEQNFTETAMTDTLTGLQPGDDAYFEIKIKNSHPTTTNWYMKNEIIQSLEDASKNSLTEGGAYTYSLTYTDPNGKVTVLFDSDTVGGDTISAAGEGLNEATSALEDWFYLDTLAQGQGGKVNLYVALDGETQNNDYQDTLAELKAQFAVELTGTDTVKKTTIVKTGDDTMIAPYIVVVAAGIALLIGVGAKGRKNRKEAA